jgi:hypothetical protein
MIKLKRLILEELNKIDKSKANKKFVGDIGEIILNNKNL